MKARIEIYKKGKHEPLAGAEFSPLTEDCVLMIVIEDRKGKRVGYVKLDSGSMSMTDESGVCLLSLEG